MTIFTVGCTILPLVPHVEISNEWGKLLRTAVMTDAGQLYSFEYYPYYDIFSEFTPIQLMVICVLLCTLICAFIGILMFLISLWANKVFSVAGAGALVLLMFFVVNMHPKIRYKLALFVPTAWMNVAKMATTEMGYYWLPSIRYMFTFLLTGILLMSVVIVWKVRSIEFNWENEDV